MKTNFKKRAKKSLNLTWTLNRPFLSGGYWFLGLGVLLAGGVSWGMEISYLGSSFAQVREVLTNSQLNESEIQGRGELERAQAEIKIYQSGQLPRYEVSLDNIFRYGINHLEQAAKRTVNERLDFYPRIEKLVHSNGICFTGEWEIGAKKTGYSGYFSEGSRGLFIGRASTALSSTRAEERRGFGFAGKIFPTLSENEVVPTANFFTVDMLPGEVRPFFADTSLTNEPRTNPGLGDLLNFPLIKLVINIKNALSAADDNPGFRPLYPIALAGTSGQVKEVRWPHWIRLSFLDKERVQMPDFRDELSLQEGRVHELAIMVSDSTKDVNNLTGWNRIGTIHLKESFVSYGCDRRLHFAHPKLKPVSSLPTIAPSQIQDTP